MAAGSFGSIGGGVRVMADTAAACSHAQGMAVDGEVVGGGGSCGGAGFNPRPTRRLPVCEADAAVPSSAGAGSTRLRTRIFMFKNILRGDLRWVLLYIN